MTMRALTIWVDCGDEECGDRCALESKAFWQCTHFKDQAKPGRRSPKCLEAESKALKVPGADGVGGYTCAHCGGGHLGLDCPQRPGVKPPERDSSGGHEVAEAVVAEWLDEVE